MVSDEGNLRKVHELNTRYNVLWIANEVQTGLARTGRSVQTNMSQVARNSVLRVSD